MKIQKTILLPALAEASKICGRRLTLPMLGCVRLEAGSGRLHIRASDLDQELLLLAPCDGDLEPLCVGAAKLLQVCSGAGDTLEFTAKDGRLLVSGGLNAALATLKAEEFPASTTEKMNKQGVNCADLARAINAVSWCASTDATRFALVSVHVALSPKQITATSADGGNLARCSFAAIASQCEFLLPSPMASRFALALQEDGAVLSVGENHAQVEFESGCYICKLVDGVFPNVKSVIENKRTALGEFEPKLLLPPLETCLSLCPDHLTPSVACKLSEDGFWLGSFFKCDDQFETNIPGVFAPHKTRLNAKAMARCLAAFDGEKVKLSTSPENGALILEQGDLTVITAALREA